MLNQKLSEAGSKENDIEKELKDIEDTNSLTSDDEAQHELLY